MAPTDETEALTRSRRIDLQLQAAGWEPIPTDYETEFEVAPLGAVEHGFADYLLKSATGAPLAIVEAKRSARDAIAGKEQARLYAEAVQRKTGVSPLIFLTNGLETWYWDQVTNPRLVAGFFTRDDLQRRAFQLNNRLALQSVDIKSEIANRPYQHMAIRRAHDAFTLNKRRALWVMATGSGKTRTAAALVDTMLRSLWVQRVLFLVDRKTLRTQAASALAEFLPDEPSQELLSSTYDPSKRLYVATLQTMQDFYKEFSPGAFDLVISDESHRSIYDKWESILAHFDALLLGLTATPADFLDRNTFSFFECEGRTPTFGYEYDTAVAEGYLAPMEAYHARTYFQVQGIRGSELPEEIRRQLIEEGFDPEDIDFDGTDLEKKVTNQATTRLLVRELFEESIKEPGGNLPGKTIVFAMSHQHAKRIWQAFNQEFPQFPGLAEIIDSHMERADELVERFKRESMPRIAVSVDMLDTGVDVPTVVNLALMKPVFSRIKFWQMLGRGTRLVKERDAKPWCPANSKTCFRVLDFWENFERFQLNPAGVEPSRSTPVAVRYFRQLLRVAATPQFAERALDRVRSMIQELPLDSSGVRESSILLEEVSREAFWIRLGQRENHILNFEVAPLMRYLPNVDLVAVSFAGRCLDLLVARSLQEDSTSVANSIRDDLLRLPIDHPSLSDVASTIRTAIREGWLDETASLEDIWSLMEDTAQFMGLRQTQHNPLLVLNIEDEMSERRWITVGPQAQQYDVQEYRRLVEQRVLELVEQHPAMLRLMSGNPLTDSDLNAIEFLLAQDELHITEESLRQAYDAPHGSLVTLLKSVLGIERLPDRASAIRDAFEVFVAEKAYLGTDQILFVRLFAHRLAAVGYIDPADLYSEPFDRLGGAAGALVPKQDLDEMFQVAQKFEVR